MKLKYIIIVFSFLLIGGGVVILRNERRAKTIAAPNNYEQKMLDLQNIIDNLNEDKADRILAFNELQKKELASKTETKIINKEITSIKYVYDTIKYDLKRKVEVCDTLLAKYGKAQKAYEKTIISMDSSIVMQGGALVDCEVAQYHLENQVKLSRKELQKERRKRKLTNVVSAVVISVVISVLTYKIITK